MNVTRMRLFEDILKVTKPLQTEPKIKEEDTFTEDPEQGLILPSTLAKMIRL
jgi:hypothetical protein